MIQKEGNEINQSMFYLMSVHSEVMSDQKRAQYILVYYTIMNRTMNNQSIKVITSVLYNTYITL